MEHGAWSKRNHSYCRFFFYRADFWHRNFGKVNFQSYVIMYGDHFKTDFATFYPELTKLLRKNPQKRAKNGHFLPKSFAKFLSGNLRYANFFSAMWIYDVRTSRISVRQFQWSANFSKNDDHFTRLCWFRAFFLLLRHAISFLGPKIVKIG